MTDKMTPEQRHIAELQGSLAVLETMLIQLLTKEAMTSNVREDALHRHLESFQALSEKAAETEWDESHRAGMKATVARIRGTMKIDKTVRTTAYAAGQNPSP